MNASTILVPIKILIARIWWVATVVLAIKAFAGVKVPVLVRCCTRNKFF